MPFLSVVVIVLVILIAIAMFLGAALLARRLAQKFSKMMREASLPRAIARPLQESRHFGRLVIQTAAQYPPGPMQDRLNLTVKPVRQWLTKLDNLEQGLIKLYSQRNLGREMRLTTHEIDMLRRRTALAQGEELACLRQLLKSKEQHLAALQDLQQFQTQAELKIQKIASDLGSTHAEMLLIIARGDFNENRLHRLDENLQEHLASMRDILAAMDDMGYSRAAG